MKNVLIITFQFADNYGALLQAYALKQEIEDMGYKADVANYVSDFNKAEYSRNPFVVQGTMKARIKRMIKLPLAWKQMKLCSEFRKLYLGLDHEINREELENLAKQYDVLVVGSDQVWNGRCTNNNSTYFLDFGDGIKKISYAASLGTMTLTDFQKICIKNYVLKYDAVSIREKQNLEEVEKIVPSAVNVVDPVLLDRNRWQQLVATYNALLDEKYILYYSLGGGVEFEKTAEHLSDKYSLPIFGVHPTTKKYHIRGHQFYNIGPIDFLILLKNAEIVCSDSFHATCFSIIFDKLLCYKTNKDNPGRAESLLKQLGVIPVDTPMDELPYQLIDCSKMDKEILEQEITRSKKFLREALQ